MDITYTLQDIMNKLFCTFTSHEELEETLNTIKSHYSILYGKIFILEAKDSDELLCTINALNLLIKKLNSGVMDSSYKVEWLDFKNTVLLTQGSDLRKLQTKINKIILV